MIFFLVVVLFGAILAAVFASPMLWSLVAIALVGACVVDTRRCS